MEGSDVQEARKQIDLRMGDARQPPRHPMGCPEEAAEGGNGFAERVPELYENTGWRCWRV
jgi:hypothetical protein